MTSFGERYPGQCGDWSDQSVFGLNGTMHARQFDSEDSVNKPVDLKMVPRSV